MGMMTETSGMAFYFSFVRYVHTFFICSRQERWRMESSYFRRRHGHAFGKTLSGRDADGAVVGGDFERVGHAVEVVVRLGRRNRIRAAYSLFSAS